MDWQQGVSLTARNTFGLDSRTRYFAVADSIEALRLHVRQAAERQVETLILGGGSNVVLPREYPGLTIAIDLRGVEIVRHPSRSHVQVFARSGEGWHGLVRRCLGQGIFGLENLALIPGNVGAAPIQNIGAYGVELARFVDFVEVMDMQTGELRRMTSEECRFGYRDSVFKHELVHRVIITGVALSLHDEPHPVLDYPELRLELDAMGIASPRPSQVCDAVIRVRRRKLPDPRLIGNAGSFFKNPVIAPEQLQRLRSEHGIVPSFNEGSFHKIPAAWLIEQCGWRGRRCGSVGVWKHHALVIVNHGGATAAGVLELAAAVKHSVLHRFGIELVEEPTIA